MTGPRLARRVLLRLRCYCKGRTSLSSPRSSRKTSRRGSRIDVVRCRSRHPAPAPAGDPGRFDRRLPAAHRQPVPGPPGLARRRRPDPLLAPEPQPGPPPHRAPLALRPVPAHPVPLPRLPHHRLVRPRPAATSAPASSPAGPAAAERPPAGPESAPSSSSGSTCWPPWASSTWSGFAHLVDPGVPGKPRQPTLQARSARQPEALATCPRRGEREPALNSTSLTRKRREGRCLHPPRPFERTQAYVHFLTIPLRSGALPPREAPEADPGVHPLSPRNVPCPSSFRRPSRRPRPRQGLEPTLSPPLPPVTGELGSIASTDDHLNRPKSKSSKELAQGIWLCFVKTARRRRYRSRVKVATTFFRTPCD